MKVHKGKIMLVIFIALSLFIVMGNSVQSLANTAPVAYAGPDICISSSDIGTTTIHGYVTDDDAGDTLYCLWEDQDTQQQGPAMYVGPNGECFLDLSIPNTTVTGVGIYTLTVYGGDFTVLSQDSMTLTVDDVNCPPVVDAGPDMTISSDEIATTTIYGYVTDPNSNDTLYCLWEDQDTQQQGPAMYVGPNGECFLDLSIPNTTVTGVGVYTLTVYGGDFTVLSQDSMTLTVVEANAAPSVNAGPNVTVLSEEIANTILSEGIIITDLEGDPLECRWLEGDIVEQDWSPVVNGNCPLDLANFSTAIGTFILTLEVRDTKVVSDNMILTIENSAPHPGPGGGGVYEIGSDVILTGELSDFDGEMINYEWAEGVNVICSGSIQAVAGGTPVTIDPCIVANPNLGSHIFTLTVNDGVNPPTNDGKFVTVYMVDTTVPTLAPVANKYILWPPNHVMEDIVIESKASDNSGLPPALSVSIKSNELEEGLGDGDVGPDYVILGVDQNTGIINLQVRRERSGSGDGRNYTVTITATDNSVNTSTATLEIYVPHDKGNR